MRQRFAGTVKLGLPDFLRIVLDPPGLRKILGQLALGGVADVCAPAEAEAASKVRQNQKLRMYPNP